MTNKDTYIKKLEAQLERLKEEKKTSKKRISDIRKENRDLRAKAKSSETSADSWKAKYSDMKKDRDAKDAELKKKLRLRKRAMEELSDSLLRLSKDIHTAKK